MCQFNGLTTQKEDVSKIRSNVSYVSLQSVLNQGDFESM